MTDSPLSSRASQQVQDSQPDTNTPTFNTAALPPEKARDLGNLLRWSIENNGYVHPSVDFAYNFDKGYHARVTNGKDIKSHTRIASAPMNTTISVLNVLNIDSFSNHETIFPDRFLQEYTLKPEVLQTFFLMEQYILGDKSWWAPYIATLPTVKDVSDLGFDKQEDSLWIHGTNVEAALELQNQKWLSQFKTGVELLSSLRWANATNGKYSWELYRWAATMYGSRSFTSQVLTDTSAYNLTKPQSINDSNHATLSKLFSDRFAVLLPVLDILNHKPGALVEWQARGEYVGLEMLSDYSSGQELFNNYGPRDNEGLFLAYGFVLDDNPFDHITIQIQVPPGSPLEDSRTWPRDERSNEDFRGFIFDNRNPIFKEAPHLERAPFAYDLLDSVSVLLANDRELQTMYEQQKTLMSSSLGGEFNDFRNLLATISQMMQDCKARLRRVVESDPTQINPKLQPKSQKQKYAQIYRKNQVKILKAAITACALVLLHAGTDQEISDLLLSAQLKLPQYFMKEDESIFSNTKFLTSGHELFTAGGLISALPSPMSRNVQQCISDMELQLGRLRINLDYVDIIKSTFAISFAAMYVELKSGMEFPARLRSWIEELTSLYPPGDQNWSTVPEPPPALLATLRATSELVQRLPTGVNARNWLQSENICWGWNVMEEEGVRVPGEIEAFLSDDPRRITELMGFLIYCKRY